MKVLQSGVTKNWEPPKTVNCIRCKAVLGEITIDDVKVSQRTEGDQRDSWKVNYASLTCPECLATIPLEKFPYVLLQKKIADDAAEYEKIRQGRIEANREPSRDSRDHCILPLRMGVDR